MNEEAQQFLDACFKRQVPPKVVLNPKKFREDRHVAARSAIIRALRSVGWSVGQIAEYCPLSERTIERTVQQ